MEKITFELEFITPAFIGGANQQAELRPASFIGLLRWWWRFLKCEEDTKKLYEHETEIFGGHLRNGAVAGKVILRIDGDIYNRVKNLKEYVGLKYVFNRKIRTIEGKDAGIAYLLYSTILPGKERYFIPEGNKFRLTLIGDKETIKYYIASLWCLIFLGGIGTRARRGGGNMSCSKVEPELKDLSFEPDLKDLFGWLEKNLKRAKEIINGTNPKQYLDYSHLCPSFKMAVSKSIFANYKEALNNIGSLYKNFRLKNREREFEMGYFGIPVRHHNNTFLIADKYKRRSSPLIIKVMKVGDKYRWAVIELNGKFLPEGTKLKLGGKLHNVDNNKAKKVLNEFFDHIKNHAQLGRISL